MSYQLEIKSLAGESVTGAGTVTVDAAQLGGKVRSRLVHEACIMYEANKRVGTHKARGRAELSFANKKPFKQKGTGRARAGTRRSPIWKGGGKVHIPTPRDYSYSMPKHSRRRATQSALLSKFRDGEVVLVSAFELPNGKTKDVVTALKKLGLNGEARVLLVTPAHDEKLLRAARNIQHVTVTPVTDLNAYDLLANKMLVLTRPALDRALELFGQEALGAGSDDGSEGKE